MATEHRYRFQIHSNTKRAEKLISAPFVFLSEKVGNSSDLIRLPISTAGSQGTSILHHIYNQSVILVLATIDIIKANNIIFSQIGPSLDFDQLKGDNPRIFQAMFFANRNVS